MKFRAGDTLRHIPSGETWVLACDQDGDEVLPAGWPESRAQAKDCVLLNAASDDERKFMLTRVRNCGGARGSIAFRQLGGDPPAERSALVARAHKLRDELQGHFDSVAHWNRAVRQPNEAPIDADPDGTLRRMLDGFERLLAAEARR